MENVTATLHDYYARCFAEHGASPRGVDWQNWQTLALHYDKMLTVIEPERATGRVSLLDVGCGFGGLLDRAKSKGIALDYTGIDIVPQMIDHGQKRHADASFATASIFEFDPGGRSFDYVVCNGVLTEKLDVSIQVFDQFVRRVVRRMFDLAERGIAFNLMTTQVNFTAPNLFYKNPLEMIAFCTAELSSKYMVDHAYPHYDYTMYVYRDARTT
jgi:SAM-dependent methyltransferase